MCHYMKEKTSRKKGYSTTNGGGLIHDGSFRALKRLKDVNNAAFETIFVIDLVTVRASLQLLKIKLFKRARLFPVSCPLTDTSTE